MPAIDIRSQDAGHDLPKGMTLIIVAFFFAALYGALGKKVSAVSPFVTLTFQYLVALLCFLPSGVRLGWRSMKTKRPGMQVFRSLVGSTCQLLYFASLGSLSLLNASLLANAAPLFIPIVAWVWLRKAVTASVAVSLLVGLMGVLLIIHPSREILQSPASLLALGSGVLSAISLVTTNQLSQTEPPSRTLMYNFGISTALLLPLAFAHWHKLSLFQTAVLIGIGVAYALTQWFIMLAYRYASATDLSPFNYSVVIFSGILGWLLFGTRPSAPTWFGTLLICCGGALSTASGPEDNKGHWLGHGHWVWRWKRGDHEKTVVPSQV